MQRANRTKPPLCLLVYKNTCTRVCYSTRRESQDSRSAPSGKFASPSRNPGDLARTALPSAPFRVSDERRPPDRDAPAAPEEKGVKERWQPQRGSNPCLHLERVVS